MFIKFETNDNEIIYIRQEEINRVSVMQKYSGDDIFFVRIDSFNRHLTGKNRTREECEKIADYCAGISVAEDKEPIESTKEINEELEKKLNTRLIDLYTMLGGRVAWSIILGFRSSANPDHKKYENRVVTIGDVIEKTPKEMLSLDGFGRASLNVLEKYLKSIGLSLKED